MKLRAINYDDKENIEDVTVTMSLKEALALVAIAGKLNGHAINRLGLNDEGDSLYQCLSSVLEMNLDEDYDKALPNFGDLKDLNSF